MIGSILDEHIDTIKSLFQLQDKIQQAADLMKFSLRNDGTIFWMGNGGSAADAQHMAAELVGRFVKERGALASIALTTDSSALTAIGNDYGFDQIFSRQVQGLCRRGDCVIGISTSGNSQNVINGILAAKEKRANTIGLIGRDGGKLASLVDVAIIVPSNVTARIQEAHLLIEHILCESVDGN